ncbi:MAG: hypothetical protein ISR47_06755 [Rhodospirillales bacterium]|nr:hypothetical protein [Rhodospirillales bacterium]
MSYVPIEFPKSTPKHVALIVDNVINALFGEFHFLLTIRNPNQGPKGSFQRTQAIVLVALADGAAQLFWPKPHLSQGKRFREFLGHYYPWEADEPEGFTKEEALDFLWTDVRCAMLHRFGARHAPGKTHKYGNVFQLTETRVEQIESDQMRPHSEPFLQRNETRTILWIENFYWGLRQAIQKVVGETPDRIKEIDKWIADGKYDQTAKT